MATEMRSRTDRAAGGEGRLKDRYLLVSLDAHVSPPVSVFRPYIDPAYLEEFDEYAKAFATNTGFLAGFGPKELSELSERSRNYIEEVVARYGSEDLNSSVARRLADMDTDGIAAEVIHHGGFNGQPIPFASAQVPTTAREAELRAAGIRSYNRYLTDWVSTAPDRLIGLGHVPIWDVPAAAAEVERLAGEGFRALNLPAPRPGLAGFNHDSWDPFWATCEANGMTLHTHSAFDLLPLDGPAAAAVKSAEVHFFSRRAVWQMTLGGAFERFPSLKLVLTEQGSEWMEETMTTLDSSWHATLHERETPYIKELVPEPPSHYLRRNCFVGASFMSRAEAQFALDADLWPNMMWGRDYPHPEGTWPFTAESIRKTFSGLPDGPVRAILGENALRVLGLDADVLAPLAERIGPTVDQVSEPYVGRPEGSRFSMGFRERGPYS